jgi:hypothetical protein
LGNVPCQDFGLVFFDRDLFDLFWECKNDELGILIRSLRIFPYPNTVLRRYRVPYEGSDDPFSMDAIWRAFYADSDGPAGELYTVEYFVDHENCEIWITAIDIFG